MKTDDSSTRFSLRRPQDGAVLVVVLLAMIGLLGMGLAGLYLTSGNIQMNSNINMRNQALYVAEGGIQVAKGILNRPYSDPSLPDLGGMLSGTTGPSRATVATPTGFTDEIPGRAGTSVGDPGCSGKTIDGIPTRGAYLRDDDPPPLGFGCQTDASTTAQAVYIGCNYPPTYSYTDSNGNSISYNAAPPDPNGMSATPTQYMGKYTLFIRQDLGECRQGWVAIDGNGIVVIRSEGTASDNRTKVVLEVTMSTNPNTAVISQAFATVCPAGAAGCDDNASVQQGITVGPFGAGGAPGSGGSGGTGGTSAGCTNDSQCNGDICCNGACVDKTTSQNCGTCGNQCSGSTPACCNGVCAAATSVGTLDRSCGPCGGIDCTTTGKRCCGSGTNYACVNETTDGNNCGGCGHQCTSSQICCSGVCNTPWNPSNYSDTKCGPCGLNCTTRSPSQVCCSGACVAPASPGTANTSCGLCGRDCTTTTGSCCAPSDATHYNDARYYSCVTPSCGAIATMGVRSPLSATFKPGPGCVVKTIGTDLMDAWLAKHSNACTINKIDLGTPASPNYITPGTLSGLKVIVALDLYHDTDDIPTMTAARCAAQWPPSQVGHQRTLQQSEINAVLDWVNNGGGLMTTTAIANTPPEPVNVNGFLKPYGFGYSTQWQNLSVLPLVQMLSLSAGELVNTSPIGNEVLAGVSQLRVTFATALTGWNGSAETALPANSSNFLLFAKKSGYPLGVATIVSPHTSSSGRIIAWGDEWITYDDVWSDPSEQAGVFWEDALKWLGKCP